MTSPAPEFDWVAKRPIFKLHCEGSRHEDAETSSDETELRLMETA